ncbi:keratin, type II cytoskeletal 4-like [Panicum virgatum]|uniref:keratin, type II cytoskeletal 4-like n=1 Tax=Panicum virgatum TaxID=38727 RepID=UPI0019D5A5C7|nr:keratin, type II cytoskeletal 4-like [Panicum virgatum]
MPSSFTDAGAVPSSPWTPAHAALPLLLSLSISHSSASSSSPKTAAAVSPRLGGTERGGLGGTGGDGVGPVGVASGRGRALAGRACGCGGSRPGRAEKDVAAADGGGGGGGALRLTAGLWWPELLRRAAGVEVGRRRRRSSVTGMMQRRSGFLELAIWSAQGVPEDHTKWNARAKNALFDALSEEIFARVHSKKTAHEVWGELETIHVGSKKLREEKYQVLKEKLNEFKMHSSELVEQIYARLNILVEDINALEISPLSTSDIIRKILHSLHKTKYNIVTSLLYEKDLSTLQVSEVVGKIRSQEMFLLGEIDPLQAKGDLALKAKGENKSNKKSKGKAPMSSSSEASDDSSDEDGDEDTKLALLMRKTTKLMSRLNKKGYNFDPKKNKFRTRKPKDALKKICYVCGKYGHLSYDFPQESNKK